MTSRRQAPVGAPLGPGSLLWETAGDPRSLLPGSSAGIMQLMLPGLGAGVTDHSNFFDDPFDRIYRSVPRIWGTIFAEDDADGERIGKAIRDEHPDIKGVDDKGRSYHALDPDVYWWAHATFTWEMFRARELYFAVPLTRSQKEQMYAESVTWYRRYGVSERPVPATLREFEARFDDICRNELEMTPAAAWVLDERENPATRAERISLPGPLGLLDGVVTEASGDLLRLLTYGAMPDVIRRRFDLAWTDRDRLAFLAACLALRGAGPGIRFGALAGLWPEGTPHLDPADHGKVVIAGPSIGQRRRATSH